MKKPAQSKGSPSAPGKGSPSAPSKGPPSAPGKGPPSAPGKGPPSAPQDPRQAARARQNFHSASRGGFSPGARPPIWTLHRPIARAALECIYESFVEGNYVDKAIERKLKTKKFGARDRRFIAETVYEMTRWWRLLWRCLGEDAEASDEGALWRVLGAHLILSGRPMPAWPEFEELDKAKILDGRERCRNARAVSESIPDWLDALGSEELGARWPEAIHALNRTAPVVLRVNSLKATIAETRAALLADEIETDPAPGSPSALILRIRKNAFRTDAFKQGMFELQDGASQKIAPLLDAKPGDRVVDACAGAGGKALHLAALMMNKGKILALDVDDRKLAELRRRSARAGADTIETRLIEGAKTIKRLEKTADRVLLDVPCSGLGVLRRNPDAKWKLDLDHIERMRILQAEILAEYSQMTKPGGRLVYATCSILPSENERQVEAFLKDHGDEWKLIEEIHNFPGQDGFDGFYGAALERRK